jgi:transcription-repair coupling factor (superfamily II helicase)
VNVRGVEWGFLPVLLASLIEDSGRKGVIIVPQEKEAEELCSDLQLFLGNRAMLFPAWQNIPYSDVSSRESVFQERAKILSLLCGRESVFVVVSLKAALSILPVKESMSRAIIRLSLGDRIALPDFEKKLVTLGYNRVPRVSLPSEFAVRGEVVDLFVAHDEFPLRILLDYDTIESIREFDPLSQLTTGTRKRIFISPVHELIMGESEKQTFLNNIGQEGYHGKDAQELLANLIHDPESGGLEYFIPLFFKLKGSLLDYLEHGDFLFLIDSERLAANSDTIHREYHHQYLIQKEKKRIVVNPNRLLHDYANAYASHPTGIRFLMHRDAGNDAVDRSVLFNSEPSRSFFGNLQYFREEMEALSGNGYRIALFADYEAQAARLRHILADCPVEIFPDSYGNGFYLPDLKIAVLTENEIFKRKKRITKALRKIESEKIDSFVDLEEGDFIVHIQHGIGCYRGIERVRTSSFERDYIRLEYADSEILFLPTEQVNLIERYIAPGGKNPRLDSIGSKSWSNRKERVKKAVAELATRLLNLYSLRKKVPGFAFSLDTEWQDQFEAGFPYTETPDQLTCIEEVKRDMESQNPMDRLVCGDVGYGKTEIALRASFKAVMGGKQVALLAPTTILVEQHYDTFKERFESFPVTIRMLSRFVPKPDQKKIIRELAVNEADIVIGTHRLVQKDVHFKNLGLLIIDEEQRFGVRHKERIKEIKANVDCLVLTATPIPRTLYMSLMKIRDMSLLRTPPQNRLPIETFVTEFNHDIIQNAIRREVERGGQVFYLHNRIESIGSVYAMLQALFPELRIACAHGKMEADDLEDVMHDFIHRNYQILVSTAIIENGIDIPNVNTIIIDRADMFGISQLYQLRGRVGRSDVTAFAYLLYPKHKALSERAMKRLKIISDFTELGSGFKIALKDLELRGAGNLLGGEQHGDILSVGFDMYMKLLHEAIEKTDENKEPYKSGEVYLELEYSGFIPDSYISEPLEKMETYKQIAAVTTEEELEQVHSRLVDRFGPLPDEVVSIISIAELRILCNRLLISSLKERQGVVRIEFMMVSRIAATKVVRLIKESGGSVFLKNSVPQCLFIKTGTIGLKEKSQFIKEKLAMLM